MATSFPNGLDTSLQQDTYVASIPNNARADSGVAGSGTRFRRDP